jgi:transposase
MDRKATDSIVTAIGIDIGKNTFHLVGLDKRGAIVLRQKLSRGQVVVRLANMPPCLVGMEACVGAHHLSRQLLARGHDVKLMPGQFVKPFLKARRTTSATSPSPKASCNTRPVHTYGSKAELLEPCVAVRFVPAAAIRVRDPK